MRKNNWGEDRVLYYNKQGRLCSVLASWTNLALQDAFSLASAGRSWFRVDDLLNLVALLQDAREPGDGARSRCQADPLSRPHRCARSTALRRLGAGAVPLRTSQRCCTGQWSRRALSFEAAHFNSCSTVRTGGSMKRSPSPWDFGVVISVPPAQDSQLIRPDSWRRWCRDRAASIGSLFRSQSLHAAAEVPKLKSGAE